MSSVKTQVGARDLATETRFEPTAGISATNVQQAIESAATLGVTSWGVITGTLSDQTDLQSALDAKLDVTTAASTYQPLDAQLTSLSSASANGVSLVTAADYAAMKALLDLEIGADVQAYDADLTAWAAVNPSSYSTTAQIAAAYQPLDADLTTIAGLSSADSNFIVGSATGWVVESGATARTSLGLGTMATETATNYLTTAAAASGYQPLDAELTSLSGASANGVSLVTAANYAAMRTLLDLEAGTDFLTPAAIAAAYQPLDGELTAIAGLTSAADKGIQFTGAGTASTYDLTTAGKALLDDADASAQRTTLGLGTLATQSGTFSGTSSGTNTGDQTITLTGDVTGSGTGSFAATIANAAVTLAKMADVATGTVFYRKTAATGVPEVQTLATLKTDLGLTGTNSGDQTITLTGDVTGSGTGSFAATLATVNANTGSWGLAGSVAQFTVNAKGLITAAANVAISIASTAISDATAAGRAMLTAATAAAQTALLNAFVGDSGAGGTKGLVPAPIAGDSAKFLRGDGAFASIPGGGDLLAANNLSDVVNAATARTNLGLAIGTNVQAYDADLATWAGLTPSANAQSLVTAANYAAMRALLDLEANTDFYAPSGTDVALADGGTGASLTDPNADRLMFWDDSGGAVTWATPGNGLEFSTTTLNTKPTVLRFYTNTGSPHTWTKPTGLTSLRVWAIGSGGGGGGGVAGASNLAPCNGGNAGTYGYKLIAAASLGATETVTVPAGGAGAANTADPPVAGTDGGTTSFGAHLTCPGGQSGNAMAGGTTVTTNTGNDSNSAATGSDFSFLGGLSNRAVRFSGTTGFSTAGASSEMGAGGAGGGPGTTGVAATGYGAGGAGGCSNSGTGRAGGAGSEGLVIVEEIF